MENCAGFFQELYEVCVLGGWRMLDERDEAGVGDAVGEADVFFDGHGDAVQGADQFAGRLEMGV